MPVLEGLASHQVARPLEEGRQLPTLCVGRRACRPESERVKGLSSEIANMGKTTPSFMAEVKMDTLEGELEVEVSPGSMTLACMTLCPHGNSGDPALAFRKESMPDNRKEGGRQTGCRESDRLIVLMKAGNAAGGKEATVDRAG
jgi:hypothetical protein